MLFRSDMNELNMKHWRLAIEDSGIAVAILDKAGESANSLSAEVMGEFGRLLDQLDLYPPKGLIVRSGKEAGFIAGADIGEFTQLDTPAKGRALVARGWREGVDLHYEEIEGARHNEAAWRARVDRVLLFLLSPPAR